MSPHPAGLVLLFPMLAPRASSAFVCLGCELKLARPRLTLPTTARRPSTTARSLSTTARRHDAADEQTLRPGQTDTPTPTSRPVRITKEYMKKGKRVRQRKADLGMKRMDEDADILVLHEAPEPADEARPPETLLEPIAVPDILSSLQHDNAPATAEDVARQLDSLRPARASADEPHYVTTAEFVKLVGALTRGFTATQLSRYYSAAKSIRQDALVGVVKAAVRATRRSEWHPTTTSIEKRLPGVETMLKKPALKPRSIRKATLVDKILRDVWKLQLLEEIEAEGELELRLKEHELKLLHAGGATSNLARIAATRNAKVEIHWPTRVLRITADKNTAEYTANDVEEALAHARSTSLDLKRWAPRLNTASLPPTTPLSATLPVDHVASLTGTHIYASDPYTLKIHGLNETSLAEAKRTLIRLLPFKDAATRTIDTQRLDAAKRETYLLPTFHEADSLDYVHRSLSLGRWALPVPRAADNALPEEHESKAAPQQSTHALVNRVVSFLRPPADGNFSGSESTPRNRQTGYWALEPEYKVSADFGQALFPLEHADPDKVIEAANSSRAPFHPAIPGLGSLLASSKFQNLSRTESPALLYDFIPSPDQKILGTETGITEIGPTFPNLHVQVRTGRDGNRPTIHKLSIGFHERVHDVLLPDQAADIRFHRYGRLRFSSKSHHDKNVEEWSEAVRQNIESGGRLSAPSLTLDIPKWTIPGFPSDATGMLPVKYLFSGIQFRQSVTGRLLDTQISYSTVQSGKLGARRGVLSAYSPKLSADAYDSQMREFAANCVTLVDYISQAGAQTTPARQTRLPRNDHSARKQRRAALDGRSDVGGRVDELDELADTSQGSAGEANLVNQPNQPDDASEFDDPNQPNEPNEASHATHALLASRLDAAAPAPEPLDPLHPAPADDASARGRMQEREAEALLDDLFGGEADAEAEADAEGEAGRGGA